MEGTTNNTNKIDLNQAAKDFEQEFKGKLDDEKLQQMLGAIKSVEVPVKVGTPESDITVSTDDTSFYCDGAVMSAVFFFKFQLNVKVDGRKWEFNGKAGGASLPGGGALFGTLFIASGHTVKELLNYTDGFWFVCALTYTSVYFYDDENNFLGHFQSGSVSTALGCGGGKGGWK